MKNPKRLLVRILSFVFFYVGWGVCMQQAAAGKPWNGPLLVSAMILVHLFTVKNRGEELFLILSVAFFGSLTDSFYQITGLIEFASAGILAPWMAPVWIMSIWALFAMCLNHSLSWLGMHWLLASTFGSGGAMLSYLAGYKLGAAKFLYGPWIVLPIIGGLWLFITPFILKYAAWLSKNWENNPCCLRTKKGRG